MPVTIDRAALAAARQRLASAPRVAMCAVAADLVAATPVKLGFLRASWTVSFGGASDAPGLAETPDPAGAATAARLAATIEAAPVGARFAFRNGAPYAPFLEYGTSRIAPRGFLRGTLARAPLVAAEAVRGGAGGAPGSLAGS